MPPVPGARVTEVLNVLLGVSFTAATFAVTCIGVDDNKEPSHALTVNAFTAVPFAF